jgi:hypothetical protein
MLTAPICYDLKVAALIAVFYLFYMLLLSRETTHTLNRIVLLAGIVLSAILPLCIITLHRTVVIESGLQPMMEAAVVDDATLLTITGAMKQSFDWTIPIAVVLLAGTIIRLLYLLHGYIMLKSMIRSGEKHILPSGARVSVVDVPVAPFSWMQTIVLSRADWTSGSTPILAHEEAHVRHHHSYDVVVVEMLTALQWFNPVVWFMRQELRTLHEYEADASVLSSGFDESQYIHLLMQKATGIQACALARSTLVACFSKNGIHTPKIKKRILMMLKPKSNRTAWLKALYVVPIALVSLAMTSRTVVDYEAAEPNLKEIHLTELSPDKFVCDLMTEASKSKTVYFIDGAETTEETVGTLRKEDIATVDVINTRENIRQVFHVEADEAVVIETKQQDNDPVSDSCEQLPQFPGGEAKLMEFIAQNIKYPEAAKKYGVQGRVLVQFIVEKDGRLTSAKVLENTQESGTSMVIVTAMMPEKERQDAEGHNAGVQAMRDEAIRVVNAMPSWLPGKQKGKPVRCKFVIPVTYRLN